MAAALYDKGRQKILEGSIVLLRPQMTLTVRVHHPNVESKRPVADLDGPFEQGVDTQLERNALDR